MTPVCNMVAIVLMRVASICCIICSRDTRQYSHNMQYIPVHNPHPQYNN